MRHVIKSFLKSFLSTSTFRFFVYIRSKYNRNCVIKDLCLCNPCAFSKFGFHKIIKFVKEKFFTNLWDTSQNKLMGWYCSIIALFLCLKIGMTTLLFQNDEKYPLFKAVCFQFSISELRKAVKIFNSVLSIRTGPQAVFLGACSEHFVSLFYQFLF